MLMKQNMESIKYYRNRKDESQEFIPSEGEIDINFELVKIIVKEK